MPEKIEIALEILANLVYLTQVEANNPAKVREYMMVAEMRLEQVMSQLREDRDMRSRSARLH